MNKQIYFSAPRFFYLLFKTGLPYCLIAGLISLVLLGLHQATSLLSEPAFFFINMNVWLLAFFTWGYAEYQTTIFTQSWNIARFSQLTLLLLPCSTVCIMAVNQLSFFVIEQYFAFGTTDIWQQFIGVQNAGLFGFFLQLFSYQFVCLLLLKFNTLWRNNYHQQLVGAGVDNELAQALFRIRAGYIGHDFIHKTLQKVSNIAKTDNKGAQKIVENLGGLMRFALETSQKSSIDLSDEIEALQEFCFLFRQVVFNQELERKNSQLTVNVDINNSEMLLPMTFYGLLAYVLSNFASKVTHAEHWQLNIMISNNDNHLICTLLCQHVKPSMDGDIKEVIQQLAEQLNDNVIDIMRSRIEHNYEQGGHIEFTCHEQINFTVCLPIRRNNK